MAGVGDEVVTRENNRLLSTGRRWVKNGDRWVVRATNADGSMAVRRLDGKGEVVLPADYVRQHVELAYATTAYRAQGRTVATAHALVSPTTTREVLYVSATRGREENRLYVDTCFDPDPPTSHPGLARPQSTRAVLAAVLAREGTEVSAHEALRRARARGGVFRRAGRRVPEHRPGRPTTALRRPPRPLRARPGPPRLGPGQRGVRAAPGCPSGRRSPRPRHRQRRYRGWLPPGHWPGVDDPIAVLHARVERWAAAATSRRQANAGLIAGLIPRALGVDDEDLARALQERDRAMERRARELAEQALAEGQAWVQEPRAGAHRGGPEGSLATGCVHRGCVQGPLGARR